MKTLFLLAISSITTLGFSYSQEYNFDADKYCPKIQNQPIYRGEITKDQFGNGYTYRSSSGHGYNVYYDPTFGGHTYVDSW